MLGLEREAAWGA